MRKSLGWLVLLAPILLLASPGDDVIRRVQEKFQSVKTLSLRFVMDYRESDSTGTVIEGRLFLGEPGYFRMESSMQTIASDGQNLWAFSPDENQVVIYPASTQDMPLLTPQQLLFDYPAKYKVQSIKQDRLEGITCDLLVMTPKDPSDPTKTLKIWVDRRESFTRRFQLEDLSGGVTTFDFKDFRSGQPLPDSTFTFTAPTGVEVMDLRKKQ